MKKSYVSYVAPEVELVEMVVETGFVGSEVSATGFTLGNDADYGDEVNVGW